MLNPTSGYSTYPNLSTLSARYQDPSILPFTQPSSKVALKQPINLKKGSQIKPLKKAKKEYLNLTSFALSILNNNKNNQVQENSSNRTEIDKSVINAIEKIVDNSWNKAEDALLKMLVENFGKQWKSIAILTGKTEEKCSERWNNHLKHDTQIEKKELIPNNSDKKLNEKSNSQKSDFESEKNSIIVTNYRENYNNYIKWTNEEDLLLKDCKKKSSSLEEAVNLYNEKRLKHLVNRPFRTLMSCQTRFSKLCKSENKKVCKRKRISDKQTSTDSTNHKKHSFDSINPVLISEQHDKSSSSLSQSLSSPKPLSTIDFDLQSSVPDLPDLLPQPTELTPYSIFDTATVQSPLQTEPMSPLIPIEEQVTDVQLEDW